MINKVSMFQRLILFSVEAYLDDIEPKETYEYNKLLAIRQSIRSYILFHKFDKEEDRYLKVLADTPTMKSMSDMEVDRHIFAIELLYLYTTLLPKKDRAHLNIADKKILLVKSTMVIDMLKLSKKDSESHKRVKEIIDDSRIAAKTYYHFIDEFIKDYDGLETA